MTIRELLLKIEAIMPTTWAMDWDNVGLLIGDENAQINKVYIALDATDEVVEHAIGFGADLLLTHHPLIFSGMKRIVAQDFLGARVLGLIKNDINYYAMHTNFDVSIMWKLGAEPYELIDMKPFDITTQQLDESTGDTNFYGIGATGLLAEPKSVKELAQLTKEAFGISSVKVFGDANKQCSRVVILPGSGKSDVNQAIALGADVMITGDIDHHTGIDAVAQSMAIIDAGHYGIEHIYIEYMKNLLAEVAPELTVATEPKQEPFWVI